MSIKIIKKRWMHDGVQHKTIGIVVVHNGFEEKAYIGCGYGLDEIEDLLIIASNGGHFPLEATSQLNMDICDIEVDSNRLSVS